MNVREHSKYADIGSPLFTHIEAKLFFSEVRISSVGHRSLDFGPWTCVCGANVSMPSEKSINLQTLFCRGLFG